MNTHSLAAIQAAPTSIPTVGEEIHQGTSNRPQTRSRHRLRKLVLTILATVANLYPVAGQGLLDIELPNAATTSYQIYGWSENGTQMVGTSWVYNPSWNVWDPAGLWYWSPSRQFVPLPDGLLMPTDIVYLAMDGWNGPRLQLSGDGQVAVGVRRSTGELWRWSTDGTTQFSGEVPYHTSAGYNDMWHIRSVSYDGSIVVGRVVWNDMDGYESIPFRWNKVGGFSRLNALAEIEGVSRDGEVALCLTVSGSQLLWMANGEVVNLPADPILRNGGAKLSDDGQVVAGAGWAEADQQNHLWRWSQVSGLNYFSVPAIYSDRNQFYIAAEAASSDGRSAAGSILPIAESFTGEVLRWFWNESAGFQVLPVRADYNSYTPITDLIADGTSLWVKEASGWWRWTPTDGLHQFAGEFAPTSSAWLTMANGTLWVASDRPLIETLSPSRGTAGQGDTSITIYGVGFQNGAQAFLGNTALSTTYVGPAQLQATIPAAALVATGDFATLPLTVRGPTGAVSSPAGFTVTSSGLGTLVDKVDTAVVTSGSTATVSIPPTSSTSGGISASLTASGSNSASVSVATYNTDPSGSGNTAFAVAGQFLDLNASGVTAEDSMQVYFYYPVGTPTENLSLKFWNTRLTPAAWDTVTPTTIDPVAHRIKVVFNASSHPSITELGGTFFAPAVAPPIAFTGFLSPIGGADSIGGSVTSPLRTFKVGSTIPVKFAATQAGLAVSSGIHTLTVQLCSTSTTTANAIDATPQGAATSGNRFRYADGQWLFNLDTKATGMTKGVWKVTATLSDKSQHSAWIQLK